MSDISPVSYTAAPKDKVLTLCRTAIQNLEHKLSLLKEEGIIFDNNWEVRRLYINNINNHIWYCREWLTSVNSMLKLAEFSEKEVFLTAEHISILQRCQMAL